MACLISARDESWPYLAMFKYRYEPISPMEYKLLLGAIKFLHLSLTLPSPHAWGEG